MVRPRHDPSKNLVGFVVGDVHYAVPVAAVREITNPIDVVELPLAPDDVIGVADVRGEVVPVVDLRTRFGLRDDGPSRRSKWIVLRVATKLCALAVDTVTDVFGATDGELRAPPPLRGGERTRGIRHVTNRGDTLVFVLDPAIVAASALEIDDSAVASERSFPFGKGTP
ncbi:MAG: chemotaxis protein CheW [Polyangiaceae bacterium]